MFYCSLFFLVSINVQGFIGTYNPVNNSLSFIIVFMFGLDQSEVCS